MQIGLRLDFLKFVTTDVDAAIQFLVSGH